MPPSRSRSTGCAGASPHPTTRSAPSPPAPPNARTTAASRWPSTATDATSPATPPANADTSAASADESSTTPEDRSAAARTTGEDGDRERRGRDARRGRGGAMRGHVRKRGSTYYIVYDERTDPRSGDRRQRERGGYATRDDRGAAPLPGHGSRGPARRPLDPVRDHRTAPWRSASPPVGRHRPRHRHRSNPSQPGLGSEPGWPHRVRRRATEDGSRAAHGAPGPTPTASRPRSVRSASLPRSAPSVCTTSDTRTPP